jgi:hypothetical protein
MLKIVYALIIFAGLLTGIPTAARADETLTISTYYPSPYGVYRRLEVKRAIAVGGNGFSTVNGLRAGQMFVNQSIILNNLTSLPSAATARQGQLIYYGPEHMLKYRNDTQWVNATCPVNQQCRIPNSCDTPLYSCQPPLSGKIYDTTMIYTLICSVFSPTCNWWNPYPSNPSASEPQCPSGDTSVFYAGLGETYVNPPFHFYTYVRVCGK